MGLTGLGSVTVIQLADRGDPAAFDKTEADLTMDNAWHDLDLSAIVTDTDASWILLRVILNDPNVLELSLRLQTRTSSVKFSCPATRLR